LICQLVAHEIPSWVIYEDSVAICFLPLEVEAYGHTLIAPKSHYTDVFTAPAEILCGLMTMTQRLSLHFKSLGASGINLLHASGVAAQQSVFHLHFHLIPRFDNDGLNAWPQLPARQYDKDELLQRLRLEDTQLSHP